MGAPPRVGEHPGLMPEGKPEPFWFGPFQVSLGEEHLGPGDQVLAEEYQLEPDAVGVEVGEGKVLESGVFGSGDALFGSGPSPLAGFEESNVGVGLVGEEHLEAVTVEIGEGELSSRVGRPPDGRSPGWLSARQPGLTVR